ncbi:DUF4364 family protein [Peptoniphilus equinus]|uniref:DUF4364 family protein n=1 Tax=Peptoniphilus equinus TaxID=3016343 RepID=A0ABY7QTJ8_9FIRM|nr:DUF4364 family protein [Peptoniphilus equinus]WBW49605.1 DUF4364 family protein [Peptoniphilus equinus]
MDTNNINELALHKLIILTAVDSAPVPMTEAALTSFVLRGEFLNYFYFKQYLAELLESGFLNYVEGKFYITDEGASALELFGETLNPDLKHAILKAHAKSAVPKRHVSTDTFDREDRHWVHLAMKEDEDVIMDLKLEVPDTEFSQQVVARFEANPDAIYMALVSALENYR